MTPRWFHSFGLEFAEIHHPQEETRSFSEGSFVVGKTNYLFVMRALYGREFIFFKKASKKGIQLTMTAMAGPSISFSPPYYIKYFQQQQDPFGRQVYHTNIEAYDPQKHQLSNIFDTADANKILNALFTESKVQVGLAAKVGFVFDINPFLGSVMGFEIGVATDVYFHEIEIITNTNNTNFFPTLYLNILFGKRKLPKE